MSFLSPSTTFWAISVIFIRIILPLSFTFPPSTQALDFITVTTTDDELNTDGDCSLREAIQAANINSAVDACPAGNGDDTIALPAGTYLLSLSGGSDNTSGDLDIKGNLTINGAGAHNTIIDGNHFNRVLYVYKSVTVAINDTKFANGKTRSGDPILGGTGVPGAGIYNDGTLTLTNSIVNGNITGDGGASSFGGAIGSGGAGGGIYNTGILTLNNSTISENTTGNAGGCIPPACGSGGAGGGIYNLGTLTLNNSTISGNTTGNGVPAANPYSPPGSPDGFGGGIFNLGVLTLNNSTVSNNTTGNRFPPAPLGSGGGAGGGISNTRDLVLNNCLISRNTASGAGGGLALFGLSGGNVTLVNSAILENRAGDTGIGIYIRGGRSRLLHTTIAGNSGGDGSGLYVANPSSYYPYSTVALTNTILISQTVGVYVAPPNTARLNGVLWFGNGINASGAGTIIVTNEHTGDPAFAADGYHLTSGSAAVDKGVNTRVITDIDYEPRFGIADLGADELITFTINRIYLPSVVR